MRIKTTHVGSLPRPGEMNLKLLRKKKIDNKDLHNYVTKIIEEQMILGISWVNNGELPRQDYINSTVKRICGFNDEGTAPIPKDLEELPGYSRKFGGRNGLITLNPKALVKLPACSEKLEYTGEQTLKDEIEMMLNAFNALKKTNPDSESELFFTAPSPGTVALFLEDKFYLNYDEYLENISEVLKKEYEIINSYGISIQIDCPDLAMGRHTRFKDLDDQAFLSIANTNIHFLNRALSNINPDRLRAHVCWGNYPGTHHCDIDLRKIYDIIVKLKAKYISIESCNHRHAHEWEVFKDLSFPEDKVLLPGVIDTTSNTVEHPELVAQRILNFADILGPNRVVASTDCGFASTASAAGVSGEVAWLKLKALVDGAKLADKKLQ